MLQHLLDNLNDSNAVVQSEAIRQAHALHPEQLLRLLDMETHRSRRVKISGTAAPASATMLALTSAGVSHALAIGGALTPLFLTCSLAFASSLVASLWRHRPTPAHVGLARVIADMDDPCFLGPVLSILSEPHFSDNEPDEAHWWKPDLEAALKRILPRAERSHVARLTDAQKSMLLALLALPYDDVDLTLGALSAIEHLHSVEALTRVSELAEAQALTPRMALVRDAARKCRVALRTGIEQLQFSRTLLRAGYLCEPSRERLLRPAFTEETASQELLRSAGPEAPAQD